MATIYQKLRKKTQQKTNLAEIILRLRNSGKYDILCPSGIWITPDNFKSKKSGFGEIVVNRRKIGNDVEYHEQQLETMNSLLMTIMRSLNAMDDSEVNKEWLARTIDHFHHPEKIRTLISEEDDIYSLMETYIKMKNFSYDHTNALRVLIRDIARFEEYIRATSNSKYKFDVKKVSNVDIEKFRTYLIEEHSLAEKNKELFDKLLEKYPSNFGKGKKQIAVRGENTIVKLMKKLRAFFNWLYETQRIINKPMEGIKVGSETYQASPYYLTIEERNRIAEFDFSGNKHLEVQRDIFIFHCLIGCRVSDLICLTYQNINDGILTYQPHKTKDDSDSLVARIPLHPHAVELLKKYKGKDVKGRIFPFITPQKYNDAIKEILTAVEIKRTVVVRNSKTGEPEVRPINEIASSHMARRTFIGNAYQKVSDPNIIGKMSGHVEGSKAFARYRNIEDDTLKKVIDQM